MSETQLINDAREFNRAKQNLDDALNTFRWLEHTTEAYADALANLHENFLQLVDLIEARYRKIQMEEEGGA